MDFFYFFLTFLGLNFDRLFVGAETALTKIFHPFFQTTLLKEGW